MNINKKIEKFSGDGIPAYNRKINELVDAVNWLAGVRTINGKSVFESDHGPVFDLSQANNTQQPGSPWALDPAGNPAGWLKAIVIDPSLPGPQGATTQWIWAGAALAKAPSWLVDPSGNAATWIVCSGPTFWGSGTCPAGQGNYVLTSYSESQINPWSWVFTAMQNVNPPSSPPSFYWVALNHNNAPCLYLSGGPANPTLTETVTFTFEVILGTTVIYSASGSAVVGQEINTYWPLPLPNDPNWTLLLDPGGLPGYSHGSGLWVWEYSGSVSTNGIPVLKQQLAWSSPSGQSVSFMPPSYTTDQSVIFLTQ